MTRHVIFLTVPGLRARDLAQMPHLAQLAAGGDRAELAHSFPAVTWPSQATMLTGKRPDEHGVVANGFYWRERHELEMWTATNDKILAPQIWDVLHERDASLNSAAWFPMLSKECGADVVCMPAPVHNPDGSESLWCYTKPRQLYGELLERFGHFPLQHFWGPAANIQSSRWIAESAVAAAETFRPNFFYIYLPHLDYAAQRDGPDSDAAQQALAELDAVLATTVDGMARAYGDAQPVWFVASEYTIVPVDHVTYPNRLLRESGLLRVREADDGEYLDLENTPAWALADHQCGHVYVRDAADVERVADVFRNREGIAEVLVGPERARRHIDHERAGEIVLVSAENSWQAYYYWLDDARAPDFARNVDIHHKPGYDPVELLFDFATRSVPLDATRVRGSHGAPGASAEGVLLTSAAGIVGGGRIADVEVARVVVAALTAE